MRESICLLIAGCLMIASVLRAEEVKTHLFILSGQSNMARLDPNESFTPAVTKALAPDKVIVVKDAKGGEPILRWYKKWTLPGLDHEVKTGDLYDRLMAKVRRAIKGKDISDITFVWMQGERDARQQYGDVYKLSLQGFIQQLRDDLCRDDIHVVVGRLSDFDMQNKKYQHWTKVREAQMQFAEANPLVTWVDTDDLNDPGNLLHYTAEGYEELGKRFADAAIKLLKK